MRSSRAKMFSGPQMSVPQAIQGFWMIQLVKSFSLSRFHLWSRVSQHNSHEVVATYQHTSFQQSRPAIVGSHYCLLHVLSRGPLGYDEQRKVEHALEPIRGLA